MGNKVFTIINDFDIKRQAKELGVNVWQTPSFLFILMGLINVLAMSATYFIARNYDSPNVLVMSETVVSISIFIIGGYIIKGIEQIQIANKMKSEFVSVASHQLRTPLSAIKWELELLMEKFNAGTSDKQNEIIKTIEESNERMIKLVNDLLDVSRIEQGRFSLAMEKFDIVKLVQESIRDLEPLAQANNIKIEFIKKNDIPFLIGDSKRIELVVENIISNSIKYTLEKGAIEVSVENKNGNVFVMVKDNGVGIPDGQQKFVFSKFFRSDNIVKHQTEGTGLGLYIAKNIVEQSGGKIWFKSKEKVGSIFSFCLPAKKS